MYEEYLIKENGIVPPTHTAEFANFLLVNALRLLTEQQRHDLTIALLERDGIYIKELQEVINGQNRILENIKEIENG